MCKICDDKEIGNEVILKSGSDGWDQDLHMNLFRYDKWEAELSSQVTSYGRIIMTTTVPINYCPMCGRRLSLRDAGREDTWTH